MTTATPGIAAQNSPYTHERALQGAVLFHSLYEIGGATGGKATPRHRAGQYVQRAAQKAFVKKHRQNDELLKHAAGWNSGFSAGVPAV